MKRRADDGSDDGSGLEEDGDGVTGFADSMARLLGRRLSGVKNTPVLAKRKTALMKAAEAQRKKEVHDKSQARRRKEERRKAMIVPGKSGSKDVVAKETALRQVATKGVVALFNAIRKHQKVAVPSEGDAPGKKAKSKAATEASKNSFLSLLQQSTGKALKTKLQQDAPDVPTGPPAKKRWAALDDNYMMGAHVKDWDALDDDGWSDDDEKEEEIEFDDEVEVE